MIISYLQKKKMWTILKTGSKVETNGNGDHRDRTEVDSGVTVPSRLAQRAWQTRPRLCPSHPKSGRTPNTISR